MHTLRPLSRVDLLAVAGDDGPMGISEELRALDGVIERLHAKFPHVSRDRIEDVVWEEHRSLETGRVRDFVPILVEHAARDRLAG